MGFKKDVDRLQQWASGAARKVESAPLPFPAVEKPADPAFENGCAGKEAYPSKKAADSAQLFREQQGVPSQGMVAYNCKFCRQWHLGHSKAR
jgi:hypothetical protein